MKKMWRLFIKQRSALSELWDFSRTETMWTDRAAGAAIRNDVRECLYSTPTSLVSSSVA